MSRLEKHKQKQYTVTVTSIIILIVILIVFFFTVGIKLLLNGSAFIASIGTKKTTTQPLNKKEDFIGNITIDEIPTATNSATIHIEGSVLNFDKVALYLNGDKVKDISITDSDQFTTDIDGLAKGDNTFYALGRSSQSSASEQSNTFTVLFKNEKPKLEIKDPQDNSKTNKQEISINGTTDKEVFVRVNDSPIVVDAQGNFTTLIRLKDGSNTINISAHDIAGNVETKNITVTYAKDD